MKAFKFYALGIFCFCLMNSCHQQIPSYIEKKYGELPNKIDFNYHVKPILSDKCFACHGPDMDNQRAGLRLDTPEGAFKALKNGGHAIVPSKLGKSEVIDRIFSKDPELIMPPPEFNVSLNEKEMATIAKWIEQGAEYKPHWSFIKPKKEDSPKINNNEWGINEVDYFVNKNLKQNNLKPSKRANKEMLIRRVSFTLTGLPPTKEDIENFINDSSSGAYEKLIDKYLESPTYGERMAADWMDVARYADSDGYLDDKHRDFSPWRDWVIKAFNQNMSYDEFTTKQLAGDLLPNADAESILATAFNRLHKKNSEAGIIFEEYRTEYVADRTATVSKAFLGLSVECARCHDHKYDPISQKDHYKMFGFFNSTNELGTAVYGPNQTPGPSLLITTEEQEQVLAYTEDLLQKEQSKYTSISNLKDEAFENWLFNTNSIISSVKVQSKTGLQYLYNFDNLSAISEKVFSDENKLGNRRKTTISEPSFDKGYKNKAVFINDFTKIRLPTKAGWFDQTDAFSVEVSLYPNEVYEEASIFYHCEDLRLGLKGYSLFLENNHLKFIMAFSWPTNAIEVVTKKPITEKEWHNITVSYDGSGKASGVKIYNKGIEMPVKTNVDNLYKSILFKPDIHTYPFEGFGLGNRDKMKAFKKGGIDELKIYNKRLTGLEALYINNEEAFTKVINNPNEFNNRALLQEFYNNTKNTEALKTKKQIKELRKQLTNKLNDIPEVMVLGDLKEPRKTYVLERGVYDALGEEVEPGVPEAVLKFNDSLPKNRLGLSKWLFDENNPLTARVYVNRIWQMHFGQGLVKTSDDFGNQGSLPSNPELLDWLAVNFIESGWDIKQLHKTILMSETYQQSSKTTRELQEKDAENILLARGPSYRLPAEMIRDNALSLSGLLSKRQGGRSVYPYQPDGLWAELSNKVWRYKYRLEEDDNLYRRSLYTVWKRSSPPPSMMIFDASDRNMCIVNRRKTSTPLQALVLLNDPQFIEASRVMAEKITYDYPADSIGQLKEAFLLGIGRKPDTKELEILKDFYQDEVKRFSDRKEDAKKYLSIGKSKLRHKVDPVKTAALATVINGIMNTTDSYTIR